MDDEKLIQLVKRNDALYDRKHPLFKDPKRKLAIWRGIGKELSTTADLCAKRWCNLRERYSREIRRVEVPGEGPIKVWPLMNVMHFIKPYINGRLNRRVPRTPLIFQESNLDPLCLPQPSSPIQDTMSPTMSDELQQSQSVYVRKTSRASSIASSSSSLDSLPDHLESKPPSFTRNSTKTPFGRKRKLNVDKFFCEAVKDFKKVRIARENLEENSAIRGFGDMIVATISSMSERKQVKAMQKATDVVMSIKLQPDD